MRILHITDSHGTVKSPEGRRDIYYISFLKKLYEIGYVCKRAGVNMIIHTGDLFHTARVSNKFAGQVSELIKATGVPFYVVPGNHDIEGYTTDTIDQTMLGLLAKTGIITLLDREHPIQITDNYNGEEYSVAVSGQEYYSHIDEGNHQDFEMQQDEADLNILAIHSYIADTPQHPDIKHTMVQDIYTNADIILTGHYHRQFEWTDGQNLDIYNPGSMMRVEQTEYNKTHIPCYGILDIGLNENGAITWDYNFHQFRVAQPSTTVFDYDSKYKQKQASVTLDGFKTSLANTMTSINQSSNIVQIIQDICSKDAEFGALEKEALDIYNKTLQTIPDEFEVKQGYMECQHPINIKRIHLKNFQSHRDTTLEFDDGLNIIVGESNHGKTAIMRAIMWVVDNYPLGTDFITAGENECIVRIKYEDSTYIERGRTLKDTGYYRIGYFDDTNGFTETEFRGFTNAVPVEVANLHQMPKVNITKDIETHLNVLSQLDAPFLITESPQIKAAAIGRITGTHVIDAAVKKNSFDIRANKAIIKDIEKDIKDTENKLAALPDISLIEKTYMAYSTVLAKINGLSVTTKKLNEFIDKIVDVEMEQKQTNQEYLKYSTINKLRPVVEKASDLYRVISTLKTYILNIESLNDQIDSAFATVQANKPKASLLSVINYALNQYSFTSRLSDYYTEQHILTVKQQIAAKELENANTHKQVLSILIPFLTDKLQFVSNLNNHLCKIRELAYKVYDAQTEYNGYDKQLKVINQQILSMNKQVLEFILSNKICPCCGQPIDAAGAEHVNVFMEEYTHG